MKSLENNFDWLQRMLISRVKFPFFNFLMVERNDIG
jgi:hypothetical protein